MKYLRATRCARFGVLRRLYATLLFFFFQAEDGIRDLTVTGVQTCALPISPRRRAGGRRAARPDSRANDPAGGATRKDAAVGGGGVARLREPEGDARRGEGCAGAHAGGRGRGRARTRGAGRHEDLARRSDRVGRGATRRAPGGGRDEADGRIGARGLRSPGPIDG